MRRVPGPDGLPLDGGTAPETAWRDNDGRLAAHGSSRAGAHRMRMPGVGTFRWRADEDEVLAHAPASVPDELLHDAFRRAVLPMALSTRGFQVLHASAVDGPEGVVALCARSHTGKSTLARGLAARPRRALWGDDAVAFGFAADGTPEALPVPFALSLRPASAAYFAGSVEPPRAAADRPRPLAAVALLARDDADGAPPVDVRPVAPVEAFAAVLEHAYAFDLAAAARRRGTADGYLDLAARVPVLAVRFRTGLDRLPAVLDAIEDAVAGAAAT